MLIASKPPLNTPKLSAVLICSHSSSISQRRCPSSVTGTFGKRWISSSVNPPFSQRQSIARALEAPKSNTNTVFGIKNSWN